MNGDGRTDRDVAVGAAVACGVVALAVLAAAARRRLAAAVGHRIGLRMERLIAALPEGSPPKLVMTVLPRLREQNDRIIALLDEQNALLRQHLQETD